MTARLYLERAKQLDEKILSMNNCLKQLEDQAEHGTDLLRANAQIAVDDLTREILKAQSEKVRIISDIWRVPTPAYQRLLFDRHIDGKAWSEIAEALGRNVGHVRGRMYQAALREMEQVLDEREAD